MTVTSIYKRFIPSSIPTYDNMAIARMFIFKRNQLLIKEGLDIPDIPAWQELEGMLLPNIDKRYLGELDGKPCYCMEVDDHAYVPEGMSFKDLRSLLGQLDGDIFMLSGRAFQIINWNRMNKFCGKCGTATNTQQGELAKKCPSCGSMFYPRISPAIIVAVVREGKILLAHNKNFNNNRYSVIAGFVEPGETFEDCVSREVMEEVGIRVKNIKYFGSQPWPFPDSLMVGFTAEYDSGEITVDGQEIDDAAWYGNDNLPQTPTSDTIAGRLIQFFLDRR